MTRKDLEEVSEVAGIWAAVKKEGEAVEVPIKPPVKQKRAREDRRFELTLVVVVALALYTIGVAKGVLMVAELLGWIK